MLSDGNDKHKQIAGVKPLSNRNENSFSLSLTTMNGLFHIFVTQFFLSVLFHFAFTQNCSPSRLIGSSVSLRGITNFPVFYGNPCNTQICPTGMSLIGVNSKLSIQGNYDISGILSILGSGSTVSNLNFGGDISIGCCSNVTISNVVSGTIDSSLDIGAHNTVSFGFPLNMTGTGSFTTMDDCIVNFVVTPNYHGYINDASTIALGNHAQLLVNDSFKLTRSLILIEGNQISASQKSNLYINGPVSLTDTSIIIGEMAHLFFASVHSYNKLDIKLNAGSTLSLTNPFTKTSTNRMTVTLGINSVLTISTGHCTIIQDIYVPDGTTYGPADVAGSIACTP